MTRRLLCLFLLIIGALPLLWAARSFAVDPRRAAAVGLLALIGIALNTTGLLRRALDVRWPMRAVALLVAGVTGAGTLVLWYRMSSDVLAAVPDDDAALRARVALAAAGLLWIAVGLGYVGLSIALLPGRRAAGSDDAASQEPGA
jgi:hypothetical protein